MDIRYNINRIHSVLNESFVNVEISEKSSLKFGKYFEISIKESKEVKMIIPFKNIDNVNNFEFYYLSNPINENSNLVTRNSDADSISKIIKDILSNDRFDKDYLKN
jgi:hypothetical protein